MKEYMLLIRNIGDGKASLSSEQHAVFVKSCEVYIETLKNENKLIAAQPLIREGVIISKNESEWNETMIDATKQTQVGYYHILANDLADAIAIAKHNPEFEFIKTASIEVRPIKTKEAITNFVYPK